MLSPEVKSIFPELDCAVITPRLLARLSSLGLRRAPRQLWLISRYRGPDGPRGLSLQEASVPRGWRREGRSPWK